MIPEGRPTMTVADIAQAAGMPEWKCRRRILPAMAPHVKKLPGSASPEVWDEAQVRAHLDGEPVPPLPKGTAPSDLLSSQEAGKVLGLDASTVREYQSSGKLPQGALRHGVRWYTRAEVDEAAQRPRRYKGRAAGSKNKGPQRLTPAAEKMALRIREMAALLDKAADGRSPMPTTTELAQTYGVTRRTVSRWIAAARSSEERGE